jgi:hypothetical protein
LTQEEEEVITISKKEQKAAAQAVLKAAKATKAKEEREEHKRKSGNDNDDRRSKKVKFGDMNQSKSYKASMKDLKKVNPKAILEKAPEKSILLKKQDKDKKRKNRH